MAAGISPSPPKPLTATTPLRRRRRRRPITSGSPSSCFTCLRKSLPCDRRRPYCSQCLEVGSECSGYKTQLTWGVGVASRGKLRGLSLPIASSRPAEGVTSGGGGVKKVGMADTKRDREVRNKRVEDALNSSSGNSNSGWGGFKGFDNLAINIVNHNSNSNSTTTTTRRIPPQGLALNLGYASMESALSSSFDSVASLDYMSPLTGQFPRDLLNQQSHHQQQHHHADTATVLHEDPLAYLHSPILFEGCYRPSMSPSPSPSLRIPELLTYFYQNLAPSYVLVHSPSTNPFTAYLPHLTSASPAIQHAICALAACNLRMKARLTFHHHNPRSLAAELRAAPTAALSTSEESLHRTCAVALLNNSLRDPAPSDEVLATILLLCHARLVESGIAKFHMQIAGVAKILRLRRENGLRGNRDAAWIETIFTYIDALGASVNNRECQLGYARYGTTPGNFALPRGCENLVGCERELFKVISRLGRLQVLARGGPVVNLRIPQHYHHPEDLWSAIADARQALAGWSFDTSAIELPSGATSSDMAALYQLNLALHAAASLYIERLANPGLPSSHPVIQGHVATTLGHVWMLPLMSPASKFLLWPLFVAGSEVTAANDRAFIRERLTAVMIHSGYMNNLSGLEALEAIWGETEQQQEEEEEKEEGRIPGVFKWSGWVKGPVEWMMF